MWALIFSSSSVSSFSSPPTVSFGMRILCIHIMCFDQVYPHPKEQFNIKKPSYMMSKALCSISRKIRLSPFSVRK